MQSFVIGHGERAGPEGHAVLDVTYVAGRADRRAHHGELGVRNPSVSAELLTAVQVSVVTEGRSDEVPGDLAREQIPLVLVRKECGVEQSFLPQTVAVSEELPHSRLHVVVLDLPARVRPEPLTLVQVQSVGRPEDVHDSRERVPVAEGYLVSLAVAVGVSRLEGLEHGVPVVERDRFAKTDLLQPVGPQVRGHDVEVVVAVAVPPQRVQGAVVRARHQAPRPRLLDVLQPVRGVLVDVVVQSREDAVLAVLHRVDGVREHEHVGSFTAAASLVLIEACHCEALSGSRSILTPVRLSSSLNTGRLL